MLTSRARENLKGVRTLILDEVHAVAGTKPGRPRAAPRFAGNTGARIRVAEEPNCDRGDEGKISARSFHAVPTIAPAGQLLPTALVGRSLSQGKAPRKATLTAAGRRRPELPQGREHSQLRSWALSRVQSGFWMSFSPSAHTSAKGLAPFRQRALEGSCRSWLTSDYDCSRA